MMERRIYSGFIFDRLRPSIIAPASPYHIHLVIVRIRLPIYGFL